MAATYNGFADIRGIGDNCTVSIGGYAKVMIDSLPTVARATVTEHIGANGETCSIVHHNQHYELNISFRPMSDSSVALAQADAVFIGKGATVTLAGFKDIAPAPTGGGDVLDGDWILVGDATVTRNSNEPATVDLTIRRYPSAVHTILARQIV